MSDKPRRTDFRRLAELSSTALVLPSSIAVGLFFGYFLDNKLHTAPWLLLVFTVIGIASGLISLFRVIKKQMKDEPPES
jgi:ATP synthase protein I